MNQAPPEHPSAREGWLGRVEGVLSAHFIDGTGASRPGIDCRIGLKRGEKVFSLLVRAFLDDAMSEAARRDTNYQAQTVLGYVFDRLDAGWRPGDGALPPITIRDPIA